MLVNNYTVRSYKNVIVVTNLIKCKRNTFGLILLGAKVYKISGMTNGVAKNKLHCGQRDMSPKSAESLRLVKFQVPSPQSFLFFY